MKIVQPKRKLLAVSKKPNILLPLIGFFVYVMAVGSANAGTVDTSAHFSHITNSSFNGNLPQFNPAQGVLIGVQLTLESNQARGFSGVGEKSSGSAEGGNRASEHDSAEADAPALIPLPAAAWLFLSALLGFLGLTRRRTGV